MVGYCPEKQSTIGFVSLRGVQVVACYLLPGIQ